MNRQRRQQGLHRVPAQVLAFPPVAAHPMRSHRPGTSQAPLCAGAPVYGSASRLNPVFTPGRENSCPCCNARAWHVGRTTAECARCGSPLLIVQVQEGGWA